MGTLANGAVFDNPIEIVVYTQRENVHMHALKNSLDKFKPAFVFLTSAE